MIRTFLLLCSLCAGLALSRPALAVVTYVVTDIGPVVSVAGINASGQVVGTFGFPEHAYVTGPNGVAVFDLGTLAGRRYSEGAAINNAGYAVGISRDPSDIGIGRAFIASPMAPVMVDLGTLGGNYARARGINGAGQVVGDSGFIDQTGVSSTRAFITGPNGVGMTMIDTPAGLTSTAYDINESGAVVGDYANANGVFHAFVTGPGGAGMVDLGTLGGLHSYAVAINNSSQVVGQSWITGNSSWHAFMTGPQGTNMRDLGTLGGAYSYAADINSQGVVVGGSWSAGSPGYRAFVTDADGVGMMDLNALVQLPSGVYLSYAAGINDAGQIIAGGSNGHGYLLTPVPEPRMSMLMLVGSVVVGLAIKRRRLIR